MIGHPVVEQGRDGLISNAEPSTTWSETSGRPSLRHRAHRLLTFPGRAVERAIAAGLRRKLARKMPADGSHVLEVGVGDGASLHAYPHNVHILAVDDDSAMLQRARARVAAKALDNVHGLYRMAADSLKFADGQFQRVSAFRAVFDRPSADKRSSVLCELSRVLRAGGSLLLVERASSVARGLFQDDAARDAGADRDEAASREEASTRESAQQDTPSWIARCGLRMRGRQQLDPLGLFVALRLEKTAASGAA